MKGTALIYPAGCVEPLVESLSKPPKLEWLQAKVGGYIQEVPGFDELPQVLDRLGGEVRRCAVFCDEDGKSKDLPVNRIATELWNDALPHGLRAGGKDKGAWLDVLVGPILVLYGDAAFMRNL